MGVRQLRSYELTCDGRHLWTNGWGERLPVDCGGRTVVQAHDREELRHNLPTGWEWVHSPYAESTLRCPRSDHLEGDQP